MSNNISKDVSLKELKIICYYLNIPYNNFKCKKKLVKQMESKINLKLIEKCIEVINNEISKDIKSQLSYIFPKKKRDDLITNLMVIIFNSEYNELIKKVSLYKDFNNINLCYIIEIKKIKKSFSSFYYYLLNNNKNY